MQSIRKCISTTLFLATLLLLTACGFQLRGSVELAEGIEPIAIAGLDSSDPFSSQLKNLLSAYGVQLTDNPAEANHWLVVVDKKQDKRSVALGEGARVAEYQLTETISFELQNKQRKTLLGPNKITERRIIPNDPNRVASTSEEEKILRREMLQNLAAKLTRQLQSYDFQRSEKL